LEAQIQAKIRNASKGTDVSYWEALLDQLRPFMAKQRLKELHVRVQQERLRRIREEQLEEMGGRPEGEKGGEEREQQKEEETTMEMDSAPTTSTAARTTLGKVEEEEGKEEEEMKMEEKPAAIAAHSEASLPPAGKSLLAFTAEEMLKMEDEQREQAYL
jgi:hypothetical protein